MIFSSNFFLYVFLPVVIAGYYIVKFLFGMLPGRGRNIARVLCNAILLLASLGFYLWGSGRYILILLGVILGDYIWGLVLDRWKKQALLAFAVICNVGVLFCFKYLNFAADVVGIERTWEIVLPIGISFYIFQALSYVIDVYRGTVGAQKNPFKLALYISFFPQLIAGPIVRYADVEAEIDARKETLDDFYQGFCRFIIGLSKKVFIADILATPVDNIFALSSGELTCGFAWLAVFFYTLEIYFDFSGYSDMAIGMAQMFGFHFKENFTMPYSASNINEFWRRWHISLSSFLKDYLYIPLGGNRKGAVRTYLNLAIVFLVCGIWHGAAWTFVVWGIYHGILQVIERLLRNKWNWSMKGPVGQILTFLLVMIGWCMFRADSLGQFWIFFKAMFGFGAVTGTHYYRLTYYATPMVITVAVIGWILSVVPFTRVKAWLDKSWIKGILCLGLLGLSMIFMSDASFNAFIYFQF